MTSRGGRVTHTDGAGDDVSIPGPIVGMLFLDGLWDKVNVAVDALIDEYETETVDWKQLETVSSILRNYVEGLPSEGTMARSWEATAGVATTVSAPYESVRGVLSQLAEYLDKAAADHRSVNFIF